MKQLVVLSGKGGTGKTTVAAALAHLMSQETRLVLADADVDAPNLGIILEPNELERHPFYGGEEARIDIDVCTGCGVCESVCRYDAISHNGSGYHVAPVRCEGCAACFYQCPADAITMSECLSGHWYRSSTRFGPFVHALLQPGQENSGKLVSQVREQAMLAAQEASADWVLIDGSPGIGCPVIAAVTGTDLALMVTEPTVSGIHDLKRVLGVTAHFGIRTAVCINKADLNPHVADDIASFCHECNVPVLTSIPYDETALEAMRQRLAITEHTNNNLSRQIVALWQSLKELTAD